MNSVVTEFDELDKQKPVKDIFSELNFFNKKIIIFEKSYIKFKINKSMTIFEKFKFFTNFKIWEIAESSNLWSKKFN